MKTLEKKSTFLRSAPTHHNGRNPFSTTDAHRNQNEALFLRSMPKQLLPPQQHRARHTCDKHQRKPRLPTTPFSLGGISALVTDVRQSNLRHPLGSGTTSTPTPTERYPCHFIPPDDGRSTVEPASFPLEAEPLPLQHVRSNIYFRPIFIKARAYSENTNKKRERTNRMYHMYSRESTESFAPSLKVI